ncbi:MAG: hypothetical protein [Caudoviricetes sp.]|nr:MAG: hypothetical protein [Caudoviricetes sp.]
MAKIYSGNAVRVGRYRSGLEDKNAKFLDSKGINYSYEEMSLKYIIPESLHSYTPDFILPNGIIVETKGIFDSDDRKKHLLIKKQYPMLDIRFVFSSSRSKIYKGSPTSLGEWCEKNEYIFADKLIPASWLREKSKEIPKGLFKEKKSK